MSDKTVAEKGHIKPGARIALIEPQPAVIESLGLPDGFEFVEPEQADLIFLFAMSRGDLETQLPKAVSRLAAGAVLWVFFRKGSKAAGLDMNRDDVWAAAERLGMRPLGLLGVDETWSAFRLKPKGA